jgi:hypothetical protein
LGSAVCELFSLGGGLWCYSPAEADTAPSAQEDETPSIVERIRFAAHRLYGDGIARRGGEDLEVIILVVPGFLPDFQAAIDPGVEKRDFGTIVAG